MATTGVLIRGKQRFETHRREGHVTIEAETGVMQPPEAARNKEGFSPRAFRGRMALLTP